MSRTFQICFGLSAALAMSFTLMGCNDPRRWVSCDGTQVLEILNTEYGFNLAGAQFEIECATQANADRFIIARITGDGGLTRFESEAIKRNGWESPRDGTPNLSGGKWHPEWWTASGRMTSHHYMFAPLGEDIYRLNVYFVVYSDGKRCAFLKIAGKKGQTW